MSRLYALKNLWVGAATAAGETCA